ncbi:hypothetical protein ES319_A13G033900v1 [Gossypium barbadense]|uniref:Uncharacterized protein n=1 Tax=Gossypium barbadense TaxID=3634 RepID=A0A5J5SY04_GOSBA|nr:hypothetical protein ES319_A13G033900v1 [Gossypium barbadense]
MSNVKRSINSAPYVYGSCLYVKMICCNSRTLPLVFAQAATRILARQLVRLRQQITNLQGSRAQIRGVATHTLALYVSTSISTGIKGATKAMVAMNKIEMMSEAINETLDKDEAEKETEELTNQLSSAPKGRIASKNAAPLVNVKSKPTTDVDDLEKRLASLRRL